MLELPFIENVFFSFFRSSSTLDRIDQLNSQFTSAFLIFFSILISAKQFVGSPLQCWMPMEFRGGWEQYAEDYCFIQNSYWVPFNNTLSPDIDDRKRTEIGYYQWVPIVLAFQAFLFFFPSFIWQSCCNYTGLELDAIAEEAKDIAELEKEEKHEELEKVTNFVQKILRFYPSRKVVSVFCINIGPSLGSYVSTLYLLIKLLYTVNAFVQLVIINNFIGSNQYFWGFQIMRSLWNGELWFDTGVFPRVTMCDFELRKLANIHRYSVQCVLMINMLNEKVYLIIWFWLVFVAITTLISSIYYCINLISSSKREEFVRNFLDVDDDSQESQELPLIRRFVHKGLRPDGVFLLRYIKHRVSRSAARKLCYQLYIRYCKNIKDQYTALKKIAKKDCFNGIHHDGEKQDSAPLLKAEESYSSTFKQ